jgi:hypothetical protein
MDNELLSAFLHWPKATPLQKGYFPLQLYNKGLATPMPNALTLFDERIKHGFLSQGLATRGVSKKTGTG